MKRHAYVRKETSKRDVYTARDVHTAIGVCTYRSLCIHMSLFSEVHWSLLICIGLFSHIHRVWTYIRQSVYKVCARRRDGPMPCLYVKRDQYISKETSKRDVYTPLFVERMRQRKQRPNVLFIFEKRPIHIKRDLEKRRVYATLCRAHVPEDATAQCPTQI